jgi:hypothetical protein
MVPTGMALVAVLLMAVFFRPPSRGPVTETENDESLGAASPAQP